MKSKKGMLLASETVKMVLALISIGFLIFLLASLYFSSEDTKNLKKAEASVDIFNGIVERIEGEPSYVGKILAVNPHAWSLFGYSSGLKPNQCANQNCICLCDHAREDYGIFGTWEERQEKECSEDGVCLVVSNSKGFEEIELGSASEPVSVRIFENQGLIEVEKI